MTVNFRGYLFNDAGIAVSGADVDLFDIGTTNTATGTTTDTSESDGLWKFDTVANGHYDVRITSNSSVRWIRGADQIQLKEIDVRNNTGNTTAAGTFTNYTNNVANQVAVFSGANSSRADGDVIYISYELANSAGEQTEFARMIVEAEDTHNGSEDGAIRFQVMRDGTLATVWEVKSTGDGDVDAPTMSFDLNMDSLSIGNGADTDIVLTFDANTSDGVITWMEDEDYFQFSDEILMNGTEKILFGDTGTFIHQSSDGVLTITSDTTVDINGAVAFDGALTGITALTVDDVVVDGKVVTMTGSASDTAVFTAGTNGTLSIVTTDAAAAAANIQITADGTVDIDSAGVLTLDSGAAINIEPATGSAILLDGTISIDAGVVTGATSITSTAFVGDITGDVTGTADVATVATTVTITDNESTSENNAIIFTAGGALTGGSLGLESDGDLHYNPSSGTVTATIFKGNIDAVDGDFDGTLEADALTVGGTNVLTGSLITTLGTISSGVWQGTAIASGYIAADAITGAKIADDALDSEHYTDGSIDTAHLAADAVTGAKIADDAIDSEHYTDGSIDTAHIADNQVTLAKMAGIARGKIIYGDASGDPAVLTAGGAGTVLYSDGTDVAYSKAIYAADITIGEDAQTKIDFETNNEIHFDADNAQIVNVTTEGVAVADSKFIEFESAAGTPTTDNKVQGIVIEFLAAEAITQFDAVYVSTTTGRVGRADATNAAKMPVIGIAIEAQGSAGSSVRVLTHGVYRDDGGFGGNMTVGVDLYAPESAGTLTTTRPSDDGDFIQVIGVATGLRSAFINPSLDIIEHA